MRFTFQAILGTAQIKLQVDVGFSDVVTPEAEIAANRIPRKVANGFDRRIRRRQRKANPMEGVSAKNKLIVPSENEDLTELKNLIEPLRNFFIKIIEAENKNQVFDKNWRKGSWR